MVTWSQAKHADWLTTHDTLAVHTMGAASLQRIKDAGVSIRSPLVIAELSFAETYAIHDAPTKHSNFKHTALPNPAAFLDCSYKTVLLPLS